MLFGTDYYPEHWDRERWSIDAKLMKKAGINVVRLAEFAWVLLEPEQDKFEFEWLDEAIEVLASEGIKSVLGTPTAAPPKWLMDKHPEIYPVDREGRVKGFGARHHRCHNSPVYKEHVKRIVKKIAEHYSDNENIAGWQIDNEIGCHDTTRCYCDNCLKAFKVWAKEKYNGKIAALNEAWGTNFWGQGLGSFDEIYLPKFSTCEHDKSNKGFSPGLLLDYNRFSSDSAIDYQNRQIKIIRSLSDKPITHNTMQGFVFSDIDYFKLGKELDVIGYDNYPFVGMYYSDFQKMHQYNAAGLAEARGFKNKNFWIMEQQSGNFGWGFYFGKYAPGQLRLWTYQSIAQGAEGIFYFRWRPCTYGSEQYWFGILDHDGIPRKRYKEISQTGSELQKVSDFIEGSKVHADVAIIKDYDNQWAHSICSHSPKLKFNDLYYQYHAGAYKNNIGIDFVSIGSDLSKYKVVLAPAFNVMNETIKRVFEEYVLNGGNLVISFLSGTRKKDNSVVTETFPGFFKEMAGIEVVDVDPLARETHVTGESIDGTASIWLDDIEVKEAEILARYNEGLMNGKPSITVNRFGTGKVYYVGCKLDDSSTEQLIKQIADDAGVISYLSRNYENVEVVKKIKGDKEYLMILNHGVTPVSIELEGKYRELITDSYIDDELELSAFGVAMITK
ncbi:MAG: beta-galactosidase [Clostridiales bacterium]|nr:beta-galactosidase [Clostridiales bacterium]